MMRERLTAARDRGTNLAFLGANAIYRHIRLGSTAIGDEPAADLLQGAAGRSALRPQRRGRHRPVAVRAEPASGERADRGLLRVEPVQRRHGHPQPEALAVRRHRRVRRHAAARPGRAASTTGSTCRCQPRVPSRFWPAHRWSATARYSHSDMAYYTTPSGAGVLVDRHQLVDQRPRRLQRPGSATGSPAPSPRTCCASSPRARRATSTPPSTTWRAGRSSVQACGGPANV